MMNSLHTEAHQRGRAQAPFGAHVWRPFAGGWRCGGCFREIGRLVFSWLPECWNNFPFSLKY
ncbi:unnamed protein product [Gulo gulo]|uniref:Uncharacterized protein n=1 Tax=Gulo gulo TaxID=48420 RepID=A0A9X9Q8Q2_GULGU|nr:unnamed protein product [Gulo gulo]